MKNKRCQGQVLVLLVVLLPVLIIALGVIFRSGRLLLAHHQIQNHCNTVVLNAMAAEARGLASLGNINPWAKTIIDLRRGIDTFLDDGGFLDLPFLPELLAAQKSLKAVQYVIAARQKMVMFTSLMEARNILTRPALNYGGEIVQTFKPTGILLPHFLPGSLRLHVTPQSDYKSEVGAPMELDRDFKDRQIAQGKIEIKTETFLRAQQWAGFKALPSMFVQCKAHVEMDDLEGPWEVRLSPIEDNPLSKLHWSFP